MANRRQFLSTLGKALGAGGLLLPLSGKGALAIPEFGSAAAIPVSVAPLPFSSEALRLRQLRRELHACQRRKFPTYEASENAWWELMGNHYRPMERALIQRPAATWTHCVELAELAWVNLAHRRMHNNIPRNPKPFEPTPADALVEAVLTIGHGDRCYWGSTDAEVQS